MKFLKYLLIWFCILFLLGSVSGYLYIRIHGKHLVEKQLTKFFGQPARIGDVRYLVPVGIRLTNLEIKNVLEVEDVRLHMRVPFVFKKYFVIAKLELSQPVFHLVRYAQKQIDFGGVYLKRQEERFRPGDDKTAHRVFEGIMVDLLSVHDGELILVDLAAEEPVKYNAAGIRGKAMKVVYPLSDQQIRFDLQGTILSAGRQAFLKQAVFNAGGWINWPARGMDAVFDIHQHGGFSAKMTLKAKENRLQIQGRLEADAAVQEAAEIFQDVQEDSGLAGVLFNAAQASRSKVGINVSMETQMDGFSLGMVNFQGEWQGSPQKKDPSERLSPAALFGVIPAGLGTAPKK